MAEAATSPLPSSRLSNEARTRLLEIARRAVEERLRAARFELPVDLPEELVRKTGVFVTLRRRADHELRGCVGYVEPIFPLAEAVALAAVSAATADGRFDPVALEELKALSLDISVLGPTFPIEAKDVVVGRHGLVVEQTGRRGLLLPQVPIEWGWDARAFLEQTCRKAGLPADAWKEKNARLLAFEAEVFGEE
jgi:AmmeMemoRadiSam system protein A